PAGSCRRPCAAATGSPTPPSPRRCAPGAARKPRTSNGTRRCSRSDPPSGRRHRSGGSRELFPFRADADQGPAASPAPTMRWMNIELPAWLGDDPGAPFPPVSRALREPDGLLAAGGDLSPARLLDAYAHGIFPWYSEGQPILWWSPDPRMLFRTQGVRLSSRFRRALQIGRAHG